MTRDRSLLHACWASTLVALLGGCSSETLALRDLEALHRTLAGELRHRYQTELHDDLDRLFHQIPWLRDSGLVEPGLRDLEEPASTCLDRVLELRTTSTDDTATFISVLDLLALLARQDPSPLSREAALRVLRTFVPEMSFRPLPRFTEAEADEARTRLADSLREIVQVVQERARASGGEIPVPLRSKEIAALERFGGLRTPELASARRVLGALLELAENDPPDYASATLAQAVRNVGSDVIVHVAREAFERTTGRERDGFVQAAIVTTYLELGGTNALAEIVEWFERGADDLAVRAGVDWVRANGFASLVRAHAVPWFLSLLDATDDTVRLNARALLREVSGRSFVDAEQARSWWQESSLRRETDS